MVKRKRKSSGNILWRIALIIWSLTIIFPIGWIIIVSLKTNVEFYQSVWALPEIPQFINYVEAWQEMGLGKAFWNTFVYVGASMAITLTFAYYATYSLYRVKFRGRKLLRGLLMLSLFLPTINAMVPTFVMLSKLHLRSFVGLIIFSSFGINAFNVMVLGGFLSSIPHEMEESAFIDGAGYFRTATQIIAPMAKPGIVTIAVFCFLGYYNSYLWPNLLLNGKPEMFTIAVKMFEVNSRMKYDSNWVGLCACIVIGLIPSLIFYIALQKYVTTGATVGALKG